MIPEDWPYRVKHDPWGSFEHEFRWCEFNVGDRHKDWDKSFGYWLFARESDAVAFVATWL